MTEAGATRARARAATLELLRAGLKPTATRVRQAIGGGGQQAIQEAIHATLVELARQSEWPEIPAPVVEALRAAWAELENTARARAEAVRTALEAQLQQVQEELAATREINEQAQAHLALLTAERAALQDAVTEREADIAALRVAYAQHEALLQETRERAQSAEALLARAQAQIKHLEETQQQLHAEQETLHAQQHALVAQIQQKEATLAEERARLQAALQAQTQMEALATERARHLHELATALEREQSGRAADQAFAERRIEEEKAVARALRTEITALQHAREQSEHLKRHLEHERTALHLRLTAAEQECAQLRRALDEEQQRSAETRAAWALLAVCPLH